MNRLQRQLIEFHRAFEHPIRPTPGVPPDARVRLRAKLVVEECLELVEALFDCSQEMVFLEAVTTTPLKRVKEILKRLLEEEDVKVDLVSAADALADIDYVVEGTRLELGINGEPIADEVHRSNIEKRGGGKNADGKSLKPAGWTPPDIAGRLVDQEPRGPQMSPDSIGWLLECHDGD